MKYIKLLFLLLTTAMMLSCVPDTINCTYSPNIEGNTEIPVKVKQLFLNYEYPAGVVPVLYYTDEINPLIETGSYADDLFKKLSKEVADKQSFKKSGVLVVISETPKLIQIRTGKDYSVYCNMTGVTSGKEYLELQMRLENESITDVLPSFLENICVRINEFNNLPPRKRAQLNGAATNISQTLDYVSTPSENFYGKAFLKPMLILQSFFIKICKSWFVSIILIFLLLIIIRWSIKMIINKLFSKNVELGNILNIILDVTISFTYSFSTIAAAVLLSSGRMEDLIAMHEMGIPFLENLSNVISKASLSHSIFFSGVFSFLVAIKLLYCNDYFIYNLLPAEKQKFIFDNQSGFSKYAFLFLCSNKGINVDDSQIPYTEYIASSAVSFITGSLVFLCLAAIYLLPTQLVYIGIIIAIADIIKFAIKMMVILKQLSFSAQTTIDQKFNVLTNMGACVISVIVCMIIASFMNPMPKKADINYDEIKIEVMEEYMLEGNYSVERKFEGLSTYGSAVIKKQQDGEYILRIFGKGDPIVLNFIYNPETMEIKSDDFTEAELHYDRELKTVKVNYNYNNAIWTLAK